eukprot:8589202-Ditylum_brightwellii.AAC.1
MEKWKSFRFIQKYQATLSYNRTSMFNTVLLQKIKKTVPVKETQGKPRNLSKDILIKEASKS